MCRIEFAEHGAVQPLIGPHGAKFHATERGRFPLGHLNPLHPAANARGVLPRDPVIGGSLATLQGHRKGPPLLPRLLWIRSGTVNFTPNQLWPNPQRS